VINNIFEIAEVLVKKSAELLANAEALKKRLQEHPEFDSCASEKELKETQDDID
jgi:hypothetical protein